MLSIEEDHDCTSVPTSQTRTKREQDHRYTYKSFVGGCHHCDHPPARNCCCKEPIRSVRVTANAVAVVGRTEKHDRRSFPSGTRIIEAARSLTS